MLEDLEDFKTEVVVEVEVEEEAKEVCFWSPGLGSPTLVAPGFIMAANHKPANHT